MKKHFSLEHRPFAPSRYSARRFHLITKDRPQGVAGNAALKLEITVMGWVCGLSEAHAQALAAIIWGAKK